MQRCFHDFFFFLRRQNYRHSDVTFSFPTLLHRPFSTLYEGAGPHFQLGAEPFSNAKAKKKGQQQLSLPQHSAKTRARSFS